MKRFIFPIICCFVGMTASAQLVNKQKTNAEQKKQSELDWFNCSYDNDNVYGAEVNKAYEYLKANKKKAKIKPIVALIGTGMDVEHEDLRQSIWTNQKEKENGKDDDKNGLIDDIHGWNFLGGKDGRVVDAITREADREFLRMKDKYGDYLFDGKQYFKVINGKRQAVPAPENMAEYNYYRFKVLPESKPAGTYGGYQLAYVVKEYFDKFDSDMKKRFPGKELTVEDFQSCYNPKAAVRDSLSEVSFMIGAYAFGLYNTDKWDVVYKNMIPANIELAKKDYETALKKYGHDNRKEIVGDDPNDINNTKYGNNVLLTSDAVAGVMQAGIIAAQRDNGIGINGIANNAEIMTLRVHPGKGEPYLKDMILAIRYAINHGASVIVLPEQNTIYNETQKQWLIDALKEAEKKGVLVIVPTWNLSVNLDEYEFLPNRKMTTDGELTNFMTVAPSDKNGNPVMQANYGAKMLDLYAPGVDVYSTYMGDTYKKGLGESMASSVVAGVAALLKTYFPKLTGTQIRDILLKSVTSRKGVEVEKGIRINDRPSQDLFLFDDLCISGGIVNAYQAVLEAEKISK